MIIIDYKDPRPIYEQIIEKLQELIVKGILEPDSQLPSVRSLAMELSINPNTIQKAYGELERRGYLYTVKGKGSFVSFHEEMLREVQESSKAKIRKAVEEGREVKLTQDDVLEIIKEVFRGGMKDD